MTDEGYFFISIIKKNAVIREVESFTLSENSNILSDQMIHLGTPQRRTENVFRLIKVADTKGNILRIITNRFDFSPEKVSDIYKSRWTIELFFKWLK